jgi:hypothetical protein
MVIQQFYLNFSHKIIVFELGNHESNSVLYLFASEECSSIFAIPTYVAVDVELAIFGSNLLMQVLTRRLSL